MQMLRFKVIREANWDWDREVDLDATWSQMNNCFQRVAKEVSGKIRGRTTMHRDTSWWNEGVKVVMKHKWDSYLAFGKCMTDNFCNIYGTLNIYAKSKTIVVVR